MSVDFKIEGLDVLQKQMLALMEIGKATKAMRSAARAAFKPVAETARELAPVETGELRDSIMLTAKLPKSGSVVLSVGVKVGRRKVRDEVTELLDDGSEGETSKVSTKVDAGWRWHFVEFGTSKTRARPFLRPALDQNANKVIEIFKSKLEASIKRALREAR